MGTLFKNLAEFNKKMEEYKAESEKKCPTEDDTKGGPEPDEEYINNIEKLILIDFPIDEFPDYKDDLMKLIAKYSENGERIANEYNRKVGEVNTSS